MKKIMIMALLCILSLTLCACGGIPGEEAAEMYPDIIGDWGRDPFGEEFVLSLSKNGKCKLLGTRGEWFLDSEKSDATQVVLTVKTDNRAYCVQMERLREKDDYWADLLITDSKEKTTVYEDAVCLPGSVYLSAEEVLPTVPEIVGEWGSLFFYEEPALTIREDGTCTLLNQPGRWCVSRFASAWPTLTIWIELDNGSGYSCTLGNYPYPEPTYRHYMYIEDENGDVLYPDNYNPNVIDVYTDFTIDRSKPLPGEEWIPVALGSWIDDETGERVATFHEDGTCTVLGKEAVWGIDCFNYENCQKENFLDSYWYVVKFGGENYQIFLYDNGTGKYMMSMSGGLLSYSNYVRHE